MVNKGNIPPTDLAENTFAPCDPKNHGTFRYFPTPNFPANISRQTFARFAKINIARFAKLSMRVSV